MRCRKWAAEPIGWTRGSCGHEADTGFAASAHESLEWLDVHELRGIVPPDGLHLIDVLDLIQCLDVIRIDFFQPQGIEAVSTDIGIVAGIQELAAAIFCERNDIPLERI